MSSTAPIPTNEAEALALGWTLDKHVYPWAAYSGPRFRPDRWTEIDTPAWSENGSCPEGPTS